MSREAAKSVSSPTIVMPTMDRALCRKHLLQLLPDTHPSGLHWRTRWVLLGMKLVFACTADARFYSDIVEDSRDISEKLERVSPLCCWLMPSGLDAVRENLATDIDRVTEVRGRRS